MMSDDLVIVAQFGSRTEAEVFTGLLEDAGIPSVTRGSDVGIFGPGFSGTTALGITVLVRSEDAERARDLLGEDDDAG
jgi:hypothetical protein